MEYFVSLRLICPGIYLCQDHKVFWDPLEQEIHSLLNCCTTCPNEKKVRNLDISSLLSLFFPADFSHTSFSQWWDLKLLSFYTWNTRLSWRVMATVGIWKNMTNEVKDKEPNSKQCIWYVDIPQSTTQQTQRQHSRKLMS